MLPTKDSFQLYEHTQAQGEGIEKDIPCKWKSNESMDSYTHIRKKWILSQNCDKRQRRLFYKGSIH